MFGRLMLVLLLVLLSTAAVPADAADPSAEAPAVPSPQKAVELAAGYAEAGTQFEPPRLFAQEQGLAVNRSKPKDPQVVAYVGASWIVPVKGPQTPGTGGPLGLVIDRGTGLLVARAHDITPLPKLSVYYVGEFQLAAGALKPGDSLGTVAFGMGAAMNIQLDLGGGAAAMMNIQPATTSSTHLLRGGTVAKIPFGKGTGKMMVRKYGSNNVRITAVSGDGSIMASASGQKGAAVLAKRFKEILRRLADRPEGTRIWPADARPWVSGVEGWAPSHYQVGDVGMWSPQGKATGRPGVHIRVSNTQVYVAAKVMHPYERPPAVLIGGLSDAKVVSSKPAVLRDWVGTEKVLQLQAPATYYPGRFYPAYVRQPNVKKIAYQARVLDLHKDLRRLMIRCQAPKDQYSKSAADFEKVLEHMKIAPELMEPIVVPLDPASYKPK